MRGRLFCPVGEFQVDRTFGAEATLGRNAQCTVVVPETLVSARHARIAWDAERDAYLLEDLGSSNGTRLDGEPVTEPRALGHLHVITLAEHYDLMFLDLERCAARHGTAAADAEPTLRTSIEVLDLPMPGPLRGGRPPEREKTLLQRFDLPLPGLLRGGASAASDTRTAAKTDDDSPTTDTDRVAAPRAQPKPGDES